MKPASETTILVVDDEPLLREVVVFDLDRSGYKTREASNGKEALRIVKSETIDLVLSDVRMPLGTGIELLHWLKDENAAAPPFIFMTAFSDISTDLALHFGAVAFLTKPMLRDNVLEEVSKALQPNSEKWLSMVPESIADNLQLAGTVPQPVAIGQGGIFFGMETGFPAVFDIVSFSLILNDSKLSKLKGHGRVRWVRGEPTSEFYAGIGLEFLGVSEDCFEPLFTYLSDHKPKPYIPLGCVLETSVHNVGEPLL